MEPPVDRSAAMELAAAAAAESGARGRAAVQRKVGCALVEQGSGRVVGVACNQWDSPLLPNKGVCAELRVLTKLVSSGGLQPVAAGAPLTLAVTSSPCTHCAATILLFPEVVEVLYGHLCDNGEVRAPAGSCLEPCVLSCRAAVLTAAGAAHALAVLSRCC